MFHQVKEQKISRGNFFLFFTNLDRFKRYLFGILIGLPTWYVIGILVTFSNDFALAFGITEKIDPGKAIMFAYAGISLGDILIGLVSQWLRSRTRALYIFYGITMLFMVLYFTILWQGSAATLYLVCAGLGFGTGFWAIFVTMGAEQFGTNLRATAATTIPNMVRGMLAIFILPMFKWLQSFPSIGYINAGIISGVIIMAITWTAALLTKETFHKDLEFIEE
jgi:hypothetical protein